MDELGKLIKKIVDKQLDSPQVDYDKLIKDLKKIKKKVNSGMVVDDYIWKYNIMHNSEAIFQITLGSVVFLVIITKLIVSKFNSETSEK